MSISTILTRCIDLRNRDNEPFFVSNLAVIDSFVLSIKIGTNVVET